MTAPNLTPDNNRLPEPSTPPGPTIDHRHRCDRPGHVVEISTAIPAVRITRCRGCDAVAFTTTKGRR